MDIIDTEIGYLGYHESESYGLVWKVGTSVLAMSITGMIGTIIYI